MLRTITPETAFKLLMDPRYAHKVYVKDHGEYKRAVDYRWEFHHGVGIGGSNCINFVVSKFYQEEEEEMPSED